ncbi:hypothetical protein SALBM135S_08782 [Streptomyces alboniger]
MTTCGSRRTGWSTTSTSGTRAGTRSLIRSVSSRRRARRLGPVPHRPQRGGRRDDRRDVLEPAARPDSRSSAGPWTANRAPLRTASSPTPAGPPHLWALPVSSDQPPSTGPRPATAPRPPGGAPRPRGRPRPPRPPAAQLYHLGGRRTADRRARCPHAAASAYPSADTAPPRSTRTWSPSRRPPRGPPANGAQTSVRPPTPIRCLPARRRRASAPAIPECTAQVPRGGEDQLVGPAPHRVGGGLPRGVEQQPGPPPLPVEPRGIGPPLVERGLQRLAGDGVEGGGGSGIEVGHAAHARTGCVPQGARGGYVCGSAACARSAATGPHSRTAGFHRLRRGCRGRPTPRQMPGPHPSE